MSNILEYTLKMTDGMSATMNKITGKAKEAKAQLNQLGDAGSKVGRILSSTLGVMGIGAGLYSLASFAKEGVEKIRTLNAAQAQLANTMQNMGTYSVEAYNKAINGASNLSKGIKFSQEEIIGMESQLRMVGTVGEGQMNRLTMASADMATKFGITLSDAGNSIAKGINNPELMRRLAMQLKIDPHTVETIQKVAKAGNDAKARLMLLDVVEQKVGGAAKAAFNADPLASYDKAIGELKKSMGGFLVNIQKVLVPIILPALQKFGTFLKDPIGTVQRLITAHSTLFTVLKWIAIAFGAITAAVLIYRGVMIGMAMVQTIISGIRTAMVALEIVSFAVTNSTNIWTAAQWLLNVALDANPIGLIITGVIALIAVIAYVAYTTTGWGKAWEHIMTGAKLIFLAYVQYVKANFNTMIQGLMIGINKIKEGWYEFKKALGLGDSKGNDAMLKQIKADTDARKKSIVDGYKEIGKLGKQAAGEFVKAYDSVHTVKGRTLSGMFGKMKGMFGIAPAQIPGTGGADGGGGAGKSGGAGSSVGKDTAKSVSTGGAKTTHVTINLKELIGTLNIKRDGFAESAQDMRDMVVDELTRVLSMATGQAT